MAVGSYPTGCDQPPSWHHLPGTIVVEDGSRSSRLVQASSKLAAATVRSCQSMRARTRPRATPSSSPPRRLSDPVSRCEEADGVTHTLVRRGDPMSRMSGTNVIVALRSIRRARVCPDVLERARPGEGLPSGQHAFDVKRSMPWRELLMARSGCRRTLRFSGCLNAAGESSPDPPGSMSRSRARPPSPLSWRRDGESLPGGVGAALRAGARASAARLPSIGCPTSWFSNPRSSVSEMSGAKHAGRRRAQSASASLRRGPGTVTAPRSIPTDRLPARRGRHSPAPGPASRR